MGFSPLGLIVSLAVLAPNLLLLVLPPRDDAPKVRVPLALQWLERVGQALCMAVPAVTLPGAIVMWWMLPVAVTLLGYYALWGRYLVAGRRYGLLYAPVWRIPVPMAILPIVAFLAASWWLANVWIALAALVLAAGHIPVAWATRRALTSAR